MNIIISEKANPDKVTAFNVYPFRMHANETKQAYENRMLTKDRCIDFIDDILNTSGTVVLIAKPAYKDTAYLIRDIVCSAEERLRDPYTRDQIKFGVKFEDKGENREEILNTEIKVLKKMKKNASTKEGIQIREEELAAEIDNDEEEIDSFTQNPDIPVVEAFIYQGSRHPSDSQIKTRMDEVHFGECCTPSGNKLLAFHMKSAVNMEKPMHLKEESFEEALGVETLEANSMSQAFQKLGLNWREVNGLINGYMGDDREWRHGLAAAYKDGDGDWEAYFEDLAEVVDNPVPRTLNDEREYYLNISQKLHDNVPGAFDSPLDIIRYIEVCAAQAINEYERPTTDDMELTGYQEETLYGLKRGKKIDIDEDYIDPETKTETWGDSVHGAHPMDFGQEGISWKLINQIKEGSFEDIFKIRQSLRITTKRNRFNEPYKIYGVRRNYTASQKAQAWVYIRERESELAQIAETEASEDVLKTVKYIKENILGKATKSYALCHINGREFNQYGNLISFQKPSTDETGLLWHTLNNK